jgi:Flp pilus assembly pilin Flp
MTNSLLSLAVQLQALKTRFVDRTREIADGESGASLVELVVLTAIILAGCIIVGTIIINALKTQGGNTATCIAQAQTRNCSGFTK